MKEEIIKDILGKRALFSVFSVIVLFLAYYIMPLESAIKFSEALLYLAGSYIIGQTISDIPKSIKGNKSGL